MRSLFGIIEKCMCIARNILKNPGQELVWIYSKYCGVKKRKVFFSSYSGSGYSGNPRYITEEILRQGLPWDIVWQFRDPDIIVPKGVRKVRYGSYRAQCEMASSEVIINNVRSVIRPFKKENQIYIQTWHSGIGFKNSERASEDKLGDEYVQRAKEDASNCDAIISNCYLLSELYREFFWLNPKTVILEYGLPRNDSLLDRKQITEKYTEVRKHFGLMSDQKIILYMPTFRSDGSLEGYALDYDGILRAMEKRFGGEFAVIVRLHPNVQDKADQISYGDKIKNGTDYADVQELYMAADYMITDYSSAIFDYALLDRPAFLCMLDFEEYTKERGVNHIFDMCPFPHTYSNEELISVIETFSKEEYDRKVEEFRKVWQPYDDGYASEHVVDWIKERIKDE